MTINRKKCTLMAAALCTLGLFACGDSSVTDNSTESMTSEAETATAEQTTVTRSTAAETTAAPETEQTGTAAPAGDPVSAAERNTAVNAVRQSAFPSANRFLVGELLDITFQRSSPEVVRSEHRAAGEVSMDSYTVTFRGRYYANTAAKSSGTTSEGEIRFLVSIMTISGKTDQITASPFVEDIQGNVYSAMTNLAFGL